MTVKVTQPGSCEIDVKRFYIPGAKFETTCPHCKAAIDQDFESHYLSYPTANGPMKHTLWCEACGPPLRPSPPRRPRALAGTRSRSTGPTLAGFGGAAVPAVHG